MTRPHRQLCIDALESLAASPNVSSKALKSIAAELKHRSSLRASILLDEVNSKLKQFKDPAPVVTRDLAAPQTQLQKDFGFDDTEFTPPELPKRPFKATPVVTRPQPVPVALPILPIAPPSPKPVPITMSVEQAYRVLKATAASSWEAIEFSRQRIVDRARPERGANLEPDKHKALLDEAREANSAYEVLSRVR